MKKILFSGIFAMTAAAAAAGNPGESYGVRFDSVNCAKTDEKLVVSMLIDIENMDLGSCSELRISPVVKAPGRECVLPEVTVAGRRRFVTLARHYDGLDLHRDNEGKIRYLTEVDYKEWMRNSSLSVDCSEWGCAGKEVARTDGDIAAIDFRPKEFAPKSLVLAKPVAVEKIRSVEKSAYIDFPVNRYAIEPNYRGNASEIAAIKATIDEVRGDKDATIRSVSIKGFASPEGSYAGNDRLARERARALADYVKSLYSFPASLMSSSWVAENWAGLRDWLEANPEFRDSKAILAIAGSDMPEDRREAEIKKRFPQAYATLLKEVYPSLRRSDYRIDYTIRPFTDVREIASVMKSDPSKLSLFELYKLAETLTPGSDEYREVFEVAVRLFPEDRTANVNAASTALMYGALDRAEGYLAKAGDSAEADYLRGMLAAKRFEFDKAERYFESVKDRGLRAEADEAIALVNEMR